jgi:flagellar biosynthesis/type III secretory pathway protein FliH
MNTNTVFQSHDFHYRTSKPVQRAVNINADLVKSTLIRGGMSEAQAIATIKDMFSSGYREGYEGGYEGGYEEGYSACDI